MSPPNSTTGDIVKFHTASMLLLVALMCWLGSCYPGPPSAGDDDDSAGDDDDSAGDDDDTAGDDDDSAGDDDDTAGDDDDSVPPVDCSASYTIDATTTQSEFDSLRLCTTIGGDLVVTGTQLQSLDLPFLTAVNGTLQISNNNQLSDLGGLSSLRHIGYLLLEQNAALASVSLEELDFLDTLRIFDNDALTTLDGLGVDPAGGPDLTALSGNVFIGHNDTLATIGGLSSVTSLGGDLTIQENATLDNLLGLGSLGVVNSLSLSANPALHSISALSSLLLINADLTIDNNGLSNLVGLQSLSWLAGDLSIINNSGLLSTASLASFPTTLGGSVNISDNKLLANLEGLAGRPSINGDLILIGNEVLPDLHDLISLQRVHGDLTIKGNEHLSDLQGLDGATSRLSRLGPGLREVGGSLSIDSNGSLDSLHGLQDLSKVGTELPAGGDLTITGHTDLENVDALVSLQFVNGNVEVSDNAVFNNLWGLGNLLMEPPDPLQQLGVAGSVEFSYNPSLCQYQVDDLEEQCICTILSTGNDEEPACF